MHVLGERRVRGGVDVVVVPGVQVKNERAHHAQNVWPSGEGQQAFRPQPAPLVNF